MFRRILIVLALAGLVGGCIAESKKPLPSSGKADSRLLGRWSGKESEGMLEISRGEGAWLIATILDETGKDAGAKLKLTTTSLKGNDYLSAVGIEEEGKPLGPEETYLIVRYEIIDKNTLNFFVMGQSEAAADIKAGRIAGEVIAGKEPTAENPLSGLEGSTTITASSAELARYVSQSDPKELFSVDLDLMYRR